MNPKPLVNSDGLDLMGWHRLLNSPVRQVARQGDTVRHDLPDLIARLEPLVPPEPG